MKFSNRYFIITFPAILGFAIPMLYMLSKSNPEAFSCISQQTIIHENFKIDANYVFNFSNSLGEVSINGTIVENNKTYHIDRVIGFNVKKTRNFYILTSTHISSLSGDQSNRSSFDLHYPDFFSQTQNQLTIKLRSDMFYNYVLFVFERPYFYCKKYKTT